MEITGKRLFLRARRRVGPLGTLGTLSPREALCYKEQVQIDTVCFCSLASLLDPPLRGGDCF